MEDVIEYLDDREDVAKTEYKKQKEGEGTVTIELWHDTERLQHIAERAISGVSLSQKGMEKLAKRKALVVRETKANDVTTLYPGVMKRLKAESDQND